MSGYISAERDGYFKKVAVTLRRDEARPDRWPIDGRRIEEAPPYRSGPYDPKRSNCEDAMSGYISTERDGYFKNGKVRSGGWPHRALPGHQFLDSILDWRCRGPVGYEKCRGVDQPPCRQT